MSIGIYIFIQIFISMLFLFSTFSKIISFNKFKNVFYYLGFNNVFSVTGATFILTCESLVSILIIFKSTFTYGITILIFLVLSFLFAAIYSQFKNLDIKCNCFGELTDEKLGKSTYIKIIFLTTLFLILIINNKNVGILEMPFETTIYLVFSSLNIMFLYFLLNSFIKFLILRRS
ncbi:MAG: hypothetical protein Q8934_10390 [Bacillota bacterium]|nr:hypothetical protein [Bacillota bacterium]